MHWLSAQCSTPWPGQFPQGPGYTYKHVCTHRKSSLQTGGCVCLRKHAQWSCLDRCVTAEEYIDLSTNIQKETGMHWDAAGPSTVYSYVHIEIQTTAHFPASIWNTNTQSTLWPPSLCQDKNLLPSNSVLGLLLFPRALSPSHHRKLPPFVRCTEWFLETCTHTWGILWGCWECCSCRPNNDKWQKDELRCGVLSLFASASVVPLSRTVIMPFNGSISINFMSETCTSLCGSTCTLTVTIASICRGSVFHLLLFTLRWAWFISSALLLLLSRKHKKRLTFFHIAKVLYHCDW